MNLFQKLTVKPWESPSARGDDISLERGFHRSKEKVGIIVFLLVITVLFLLFITAYNLRMQLPDWQSLNDPDILWTNTVLLALGSIALQWASVCARKGQHNGLKIGLVMGAGFSLAFLVGQYYAWVELSALGYFAITNPAYSFFYLITAIHGVHIIGGLVAWGKTAGRILMKHDLAKIRMSVELCTIYWHYLFVVWLVLFWMLKHT